jgi:predicted phosphoadenosine phosphosulfate sulfurtransferase
VSTVISGNAIESEVSRVLSDLELLSLAERVETINAIKRELHQYSPFDYVYRFKKFIYGWHNRGYARIPEEAPPELEAQCWAPSWRRMCKTLLRNDYWCKGLGQTQPKSDAYQRFKEIRKQRRQDDQASLA